VGRFETVIGRIRQGLNPGAATAPPHSTANGQQGAESRPRAAGELRAQFIAALTAVGGHPIEVADEAETVERISGLVRSAGIRSAVIGAGITTDSALLAMRLAGNGCEVTTVRAQGGPSAAGFKKRLSEIDAGIVEADYAIAATGTLALVAGPERPRSVSLLPPTNIVLLRAKRILPDLAAVLRAVGPETVAAHPMVLVTGPSRTADIEKRIVIGVHGPKELYVVIIGNGGATE
jgi:L-lactate dehydrogenase complex protein LldG